MSIRDYQFIVGAETSTLPAAGTPSGDGDTITKGYADDHYVQGGLPVADLTALAAIAGADRADGDVLLVKSSNTLYRFDSSSSASADGTRIVAPAVGTGRWFIINPGQDALTGDFTVDRHLIVTGDMTVNGTTTTLNTATLDVEDANVTVNKGGTASTANTNVAGLTVEASGGTAARIGYDSTKASFFKAGATGSESEIVTTATNQIFTGNKTFDEAINLKAVTTPTTPSSGYQKIYPKSDGNIYRLPSDGIERLLVGGASGTESGLLLTNANYTVLDTDGYTTLFFSTGSSDRTLTLPTLADNQSRFIKIVKIDSGTGKVIIDGEGSETINGSTTAALTNQYECVFIQAITTEWKVLNLFHGLMSEIIVSGGSGHGSTNTLIRRFTSLESSLGTDITWASGSSIGDTFTISARGKYAITYQDQRTAGQGLIGLSVNDTQLTTGIKSTNAPNILGYAATDSANEAGNLCVVKNFNAGDVIRCKTDGLPNETDAKAVRIIITQLAKY